MRELWQRLCCANQGKGQSTHGSITELKALEKADKGPLQATNTRGSVIEWGANSKVFTNWKFRGPFTQMVQRTQIAWEYPHFHSHRRDKVESWNYWNTVDPDRYRRDKLFGRVYETDFLFLLFG